MLSRERAEPRLTGLRKVAAKGVAAVLRDGEFGSAPGDQHLDRRAAAPLHSLESAAGATSCMP
jgi:hypothetical protein